MQCYLSIIYNYDQAKASLRMREMRAHSPVRQSAGATDLAVESVNGSLCRRVQMLRRVVSLVARAAHCCLLALGRLRFAPGGGGPFNHARGAPPWS